MDAKIKELEQRLDVASGQIDVLRHSLTAFIATSSELHTFLRVMPEFVQTIDAEFRRQKKSPSFLDGAHQTLESMTQILRDAALSQPDK